MKKERRTPTSQLREAVLQEEIKKTTAIENIAASLAGHTKAITEMNEIRKATIARRKCTCCAKNIVPGAR